MCIRHNGRFSEHIPQYKVCTLASDTGQPQKLLHRIRDPPAVFRHQHPHTPTDIPGFASAQSAWTDNLLDLLRRCLCKRLRTWILCVQILYYNIDSGIRTLCSKPDTDKQFPRIIIIQCAVCIRICLTQPLNHLECQSSFSLKIFVFLCHFPFLHLYPALILHAVPPGPTIHLLQHTVSAQSSSFRPCELLKSVSSSAYETLTFPASTSW